MGQQVRHGGLYETIKEGENIVTLTAVSSGAAMGQQVRHGELYETIKEGENIVTLKAVSSGRQWVSG